MCELKNTVRFAFGDGADKPAIGEAVAFVKGLDVVHEDIEAVYRMADEKSLFVKFKYEYSMLHMLEANPQELVFRYANGKQVKVHMTHAQDRICYVRIYDLPPEVPDQEIISVLAKFGEVKRVVREKIPAELGLDAFSGVRGAFMDVKKEIPSSLHFASRRGNIYYPGNKDKCHVCKEDGHLMADCPRRKVRNQPKKRQQEKDQTGILSESYSGAVAGGAATGQSEAGESPSDSRTYAGAVTGRSKRTTETEGVQRDSGHKRSIELHEEESAAAGFDLISFKDDCEKATIQLTAYIAEENAKSTNNNNNMVEEFKTKSPPRKKKNYNK